MCDVDLDIEYGMTAPDIASECNAAPDLRAELARESKYRHRARNQTPTTQRNEYTDIREQARRHFSSQVYKHTFLIAPFI